MLAYNEALTIEKIVSEYYSDILLKLPQGSEFILYLDKPTDATPKIAVKLKKKLPKLSVFLAEKNLGYAKAMRAALAQTKNDLIFYSDASGKHQAKDFWQLLSKIKQADIVTGQRSNRSDPFVRQSVSFCSQLLTVSLFQTPFFDYNAGFKLMRRDIITLIVPQIRYTKQSFSTELIVRSLKKGFRVIAVPVLFRDRKIQGQGTNYKQLPSIVFNNARGLFLLWFELVWRI